MTLSWPSNNQEHFANLTVFRLTEPASVQYKQVAVIGTRRKRHQYLRDSALLESVRWLEILALKPDLPADFFTVEVWTRRGLQRFLCPADV